jgi:glycosyltransferase involved in cell wall biosynthesis
MKNPLISVIITCFNRQAYLSEAIDSVLAQTCTDREVILIDDGSIDDSADLIAQYGDKLQYHYQDNQGAAAAKNRGAELATGRYLTFLDSDDLWTADKLEVQLEYVREHPEVSILYAHGVQFLSPELTREERAGLYCPSESMPAPTSGTLFLECETFLAVGPFQKDLKVGIDIEWHLRARAADLTIVMLPEVLLHRRIHKTNSGFIHKRQQKQHAAILKAHLDRKRRHESERAK